MQVTNGHSPTDLPFWFVLPFYGASSTRGNGADKLSTCEWRVCLCTQYLDDPMLVPLTEDDYIAFGLACCFVMNDNLKLDGKCLPILLIPR